MAQSDTPARAVVFSALKGLPEIKPGDCLATAISASLEKSATAAEPGDVFVIAQKIVSKSEGRLKNLREINPSPFALTVAKRLDKDPRLVEVILGETRKILRMEKVAPEKGRLIVETRSGLVMANAGVDTSNTGAAGTVTLLPENPDLSAQKIARKLSEKFGAQIAVIISDTTGRPWRQGLVDIAIGCAGIKPLDDRRGEKDLDGKPLTATEMAAADQIAAGAGLLMEKNSALPVVLARGVKFVPAPAGSAQLVRDPSEDLFR